MLDVVSMTVRPSLAVDDQVRQGCRLWRGGHRLRLAGDLHADCGPGGVDGLPKTHL
jgi:hypothetical protein